MEENKKIILFDIDDTLFNTARFIESDLQDFGLYDDVLETLIELRAYATLGIFSQGESEFQQTKLTSTKISDYFLPEDVHILLSKDEDLTKVFMNYNDHKIYVVDDRIQWLKNVKNAFPYVFTVWIQQGRYAHTQDDEQYVPDATVTSLAQIKKLVL
jgi:FMN phosphatase YigB (HAD superfamily)